LSVQSTIYFHPEAYTISGPQLMGRNAAGNSFLKGYVSHSKSPSFAALVEQPAHGADLIALVGGFNDPRPVKAYAWGAIEQVRGSTLYLPMPDLSEFAWRREHLGSSAFSLCGITHTTASAGVMDAICAWLSSPVQAWDAVICTSQVVKQTIELVLAEQLEFLRRRFAFSGDIASPQLPVIPLGINAKDFVFTDADKKLSRQTLGISDDAVVILFAGRLSFHAKAHPLAMYQAIKRAAKDKQVVLIECGWFANEHIEQAFQDAFNLVCPGIKRIVLDGRQIQDRKLAWSSADIFCSLSDNFQETFGLTPLEAMAAGLPVVVSDWNGYRDTVRDGIDGYRVPTCQPPPGMGEDLAFRHAANIDTYDVYCGLTSQLVAVDIAATERALTGLIDNPALRKQMGNAGQFRARQDFDWAVIIPRYEALWAELNALRASHEAGKEGGMPHKRPMRLDPFTLFESYPTRTLRAQDLVMLSPHYFSAQSAYQRLLELRALKMVQFGEFAQLSSADCNTIFQFLEGGAKLVGQIVALGSPEMRMRIHRALVWLMKLGLIQLS